MRQMTGGVQWQDGWNDSLERTGVEIVYTSVCVFSLGTVPSMVMWSQCSYCQNQKHTQEWELN